VLQLVKKFKKGNEELERGSFKHLSMILNELEPQFPQKKVLSIIKKIAHQAQDDDEYSEAISD
jgi:hypothetical protein